MQSLLSHYWMMADKKEWKVFFPILITKVCIVVRLFMQYISSWRSGGQIQKLNYDTAWLQQTLHDSVSSDCIGWVSILWPFVRCDFIGWVTPDVWLTLDLWLIFVEGAWEHICLLSSVFRIIFGYVQVLKFQPAI